MLIIFIRTVLLFIVLTFTIRIMGKRHMGELELGELVTTLMISEIATLPLENPSTPLLTAVVPIVTLMLLEIGISMILTKIPKLKSLVSPRPSILIRKGVLDQSELKRLRISVEELMSVLRQNNVADISDVNYAIMEQNAKITIIPKSAASPPAARDMNIETRDTGLPHILIEDGVPNKYNLKKIDRDEQWLVKEIENNGHKVKDIFLFTVDDCQTVNIILKDKSSKGRKQ